MDTLECRKKQQSLILLFKCISNIGPKYIRDLFSIRETSYNSREKGVNLCIPKFNLNFVRNSFTYKGAQLWNKISEDVKLADNVNIFKSKLRSISAVIFIFLIRDWSKSIAGGVGRRRDGVGHEVLSLVQGVGSAIFSYP